MIQGEAQMTKTLTNTKHQRLEAKIIGVKAQAKHRRGTGTSAQKPPKFDGTTSWAMFRHQFEAVAEHNCRTCLEKSTYSIVALQAQATEVLHSILKEATYKEMLETREDRFADQNLAAVYRSQLNTRSQGIGESLQEFVTAIKQLVHRACLAPLEAHIRSEIGKAFAERVEDPTMLGKKMTNKALRQALELQTGPPKKRVPQRSGGANCSQPG
jgi:hypothetical protein